MNRDIINNFNEFLNKKNDKLLRLKDIISIPIELNDIFELCKNEIEISNSDLLIIDLYSKIFFDCLMQHKNLTYGKIDIISDIRNILIKSNNENDVKRQYKQITNPKHILSAVFLKMLTDYKQIDFVNEKLRKYGIINIMSNLVKDSLTNTSHYSNNFKKLLLNSKIDIMNYD